MRKRITSFCNYGNRNTPDGDDEWACLGLVINTNATIGNIRSSSNKGIPQQVVWSGMALVSQALVFVLLHVLNNYQYCGCGFIMLLWYSRGYCSSSGHENCIGTYVTFRTVLLADPLSECPVQAQTRINEVLDIASFRKVATSFHVFGRFWKY